MTNNEESAFVQNQLRQARAKGFKQPVLLGLVSLSQHARAVHEALRGEPMPPPSQEDGTDGDRAFVVRGPVVAELLREFAGDGGDFIARMLADHPGIDIWRIALLADGINYCAFLDGVKLLQGHAPYENGGRRQQTVREAMTGEGPTMLHLAAEDGTITPVCGPSGSVATLAGYLVVAVAAERLLVPHEGRTIEMTVDDNLLAYILLHGFADAPVAVAEAVMALRKRKRYFAERLLGVLAARPELRALSDAVRRELAGE